MSLFGSRTRTYVSSVAYNMAGDLADRPDFLKSTVSQAALASSMGRRPRSIADDLTQSILKGPGMNQRALFRWARASDYIGRVTGSINDHLNVRDTAIIASHLPGSVDRQDIKAAFLDTADVQHWADRWILQNRKADITLEWTADYLPGSNQIRITWPDASTSSFTPSPAFVAGATYLYCYYARVSTSETEEVYIYRIGSGNAALDALDTVKLTTTEFYPIVPLRIDNKRVDHTDYSAKFPEWANGYKRCVGQSIDRILDSIDDNASVGDIDYAFMMHGVELNTQEAAGKRYLYEFFRNLIPYQNTSVPTLATMHTWNDEMAAYENAYLIWILEQANQEEWPEANKPPQPPLRKTPPLSQIRIKSADTTLNFDMRLSWLSIDEEIFAGKILPTSQRGDMFWTRAGDFTLRGVRVGGTTNYRDLVFNVVTLWWQHEENAHRRLEIIGLIHEIFPYRNKAVAITAAEALSDPDESGFVVPMHYETVKEMPIVMANQLALSNRILVFNCIVTKKLRWYQRGIFKILAFVVIGAVMAIFAPAAVGLLGSNLAVGAALGFSGVTAAVVGGIANTVAAVIVATLIETGAKGVFGEKIGAIVGMVATLLTFQYVGSFQMTGSWGLNWGEIFRAENLLKLTNAVTGTLTDLAQAEIGDIQADLVQLTTTYEDRMNEIEKRTAQLLGYGGGMIDPLQFTERPDIFVPRAESSSTFLSRTLLTGSDLAQTSLDMVSDFTELSLDLPKMIV